MITMLQTSTMQKISASNRDIPRDLPPVPVVDGAHPEALLAALDAQPELKPALLALGATLSEHLDARTWELVALRVAAANANDYIWSAHVLIATYAGFAPSEVACIAVGPTVNTGREAAVLSCVDDVLHGRPIDERARGELGEQETLGIQIATGFYVTIDSITRRLAPEPGLRTVPGLETPAAARASYAETFS
jgi:AhpD family alkylhydroperoxidase